MDEYLTKIYEYAILLNVKPMVFGAPNNRKLNGLNFEQGFEIAVQFFQRLLDSWEADGPFIAFESNPSEYGCDFITNNVQCLQLVGEVNRLNFRWHFDYTCSILAGETPTDFIRKMEYLPSHVHLSERALGPLVESNQLKYIEFLGLLSKRDYKGIITLEMKQSKNIEEFYETINLFNKVVDAIEI
jgi:sugar phosphate isomerase/epimerase